MMRKLLLRATIILFCIAFHSLSTQARVFKPVPGDTIKAASIINAIERGDSIIIAGCIISGPVIIEGLWGATLPTESFVAIYWSTFLDAIYLANCHFKDQVSFYSDSFSKNVNFLDVTFGRDALFTETTFGGYANFYSTAFVGYADFSDAVFARGTSFRDVTFGLIADFSDTKFQEWVDLSPREFEDIYISWKQLKSHLEYNLTSNYRLMKYFEDQRKFRDADGFFLFIKDHERMEKDPLIRYPEYWFIQLTCGYGRRPLNTLILSLALVVLFALIFTKPKAIEQIERGSRYRRRPRPFRDVPKRWGKRFYYALYFSLHTFIIGIVSDWHPTDEFLIGDSEKRGIKLFRFRTLSMIEGALGWILVIILIISLERTIGR